MYSLLDLLSDLHRLVECVLIEVDLAEIDSVRSKSTGTFLQGLNRCKVVVGREVPEERRGYPDQRAIRVLRLPTLNRLAELQIGGAISKVQQQSNEISRMIE